MNGCTIKHLLADLDKFSSPIPLDMLVQKMKALKITLREVREFVQFGDDCYCRNPMHNGPAYQALILCWRSGQRSPIHDHNGSACGVRVLEGVGTEVRFEQSPCGLIYPTQTGELSVGSVCGSFDSDMHQMGNLQPAGKNLVTLHVYSPPLVAMRTYFLGNAILGEDDAVVRRVIRSRAERHKPAAVVPVAAARRASRPARKRRQAVTSS